ncbi:MULTISPECIES: hypothetical protein [unclassified Streptomyces]|uniref:hypothetical protein n=1 Tax=unclassified Streptomyces TaxID=2593676 RepID=UPI00381B1F48
MSESEVLALPVTIPLELTNRAIGLGRTVGYDLAKHDKYPIPVLRIANAYRCRRVDLLEYLGIHDKAGTA